MKKLLLVAVLGLLAALPARAQSHQVALSWAASSATSITGYNVYRLAGNCPASVNLSLFTKLTSTPVTTTSFTDTNVTAGSTYCYAATTVASGGESGANGTLQATIPIFTASAIPAPPGAFQNSSIQ